MVGSKPLLLAARRRESHAIERDVFNLHPRFCFPCENGAGEIASPVINTLFSR
jgi:hypothetical protein